MAAHAVLLFLLFCKVDKNGIAMAFSHLEEEQDLQVTLSEKQPTLPHSESVGNLSGSLENQSQNSSDDVRTLPNFRLTDGGHFELKDDAARQTGGVKQPASATKSVTTKHSPALAVQRRQSSSLTDGEVEDVINAHGLVSGSQQEQALQPELYSETGVADGVPGRAQGHANWVTEYQDAAGPGPFPPRARQRRSWLWNQFFVIEEYQGPEPVLIGRLHTDMDRGDGRTKYLLEGEGVGSVFVIDGNTGNIHVTKALDREEKDQYRLVATATDRLSGRALEPSSEFIIRVQDINDNPPIFPRDSYLATVPEMANIGTSIIQVTAIDADDPTYGNSARLVYALTQGQDYFSVDPQTGVLRTAVPDMDRESREQYVAVLQARDMGGHLGGLSGTTTVTVELTDVNDNPPHFRRSAWSFSVSELAAPGVEVGRLTASDPDVGENAQLEFSILDTEEGEIFNITGRGHEAIIVLNRLLDYESQSSYTFSVEVANPVVDARYIRQGPFKDQATVRVMVLNADEPPRFSQARYHLDVSENCPPVCSVGRVYALDPDTGQGTNIRYSIDPQSDPEALFRIASDTGFISTVMELDREHEQWHNVTVMATQRDNPNLVSRVVVAIETLDQNDNAPELDRQYTTSVCDSSAPGQVVQVLRAIDKDQGGQDSPVHFSISPESSSALNLSIRETGGVTASLVLRSALEPVPGFSSSLLTLYVPVVLRDGASGLTNTATVTVTICPCESGGMQTEDRGRQRDRRWERHMVCLPTPSASTSLIFSLVTLLAMLACVTTLLVVCALSLSLRPQKRDSLSPLEEDDVRENIISYDDEGGGEADTAAFDMAALQSMHRMHSMHSNRNIWYTQQNQTRARTYSWNRALRPCLDPQQRPGSAPLYGRLCYGLHTLPVLRDYPSMGPLEGGVQLTPLTQPMGSSLLLQNKSPFDPASPAYYQAQNTLAKSNITERDQGSEASSAQQQDKQDQHKTASTETESSSTLTPGAMPLGPPTEPYLSPSCSSSTQPQGDTEEDRPGSSQTQGSTEATSCTLDMDLDTDSSVRSVSEHNSSNGKVHCANLPLLPPADTYSVVGSLNPNTAGDMCVNGTVGGLYQAGVQLLSMCRLPVTKDLSPRPLPLRMEDLLNIRLERLTLDPQQPPYDSLQTYQFEGRDSRAESLSSLESREEQEEQEEEEEGGRDRAAGMEQLNHKFERLVEIIRERETEKEKGQGGHSAEVIRERETEKQEALGGHTAETHKPQEETAKELHRWDF